MGAPEEVLIIAPCEWGDVLAEILAPCFTRVEALVDVGRQVVEGRAIAFTADNGGGIVGAFVLRVDGEEGVIMAAAGQLRGVSLVPLLLPHIENKFIACKSIRFHTARPAMAHVMSQYGYSGMEVVLRKEVR